jgi:3-deoxy-D-manno-octulosonic-acid transferase
MDPWPYLYNIPLALMTAVSAPAWGVLLLTHPKHRAGFLQKATGIAPTSGHTEYPIWYHAVSVGEVMASLPLIRLIMENFPERPLRLSTVTATGQATARARVRGSAQTFYFPYDLPWIMDRAIHRLRPRLFITTETEIWPNCVWRLRRYGIPVVLVNGRISDRSFRWYRRFRLLFRRVLGDFDLLCMQSQEMAARARTIGAKEDRICVTGNLKFDQELPDPVDQRAWRRRLRIGDEEPTVIAGSTHPGEEEIILRVFGRLATRHRELKLILAPRAPERFEEVEGLIAKTGFSVVRRSRIEKMGSGDSHRVILLDTIGELSQIYGIGHVAFVGGSLIAHGGHNPLEVAAHGRVVLFGSHMENFRDIGSLMIEGGGAMEVAHEAALETALGELLADPRRGAEMGQNALRTLISHRGAADRTLTAIRPFLG